MLCMCYARAIYVWEFFCACGRLCVDPKNREAGYC